MRRAVRALRSDPGSRDQISEWIKETRHKVMYRDESKID